MRSGQPGTQPGQLGWALSPSGRLPSGSTRLSSGSFRRQSGPGCYMYAQDLRPSPPTAMSPRTGPEKQRMPTYGHAQILGLSEDVRRAWDQEREALRQAGVDADVGLARMQAVHDQAADP